MGNSALFTSTVGSYNMALGYSSLKLLTDGCHNVFIGYQGFPVPGVACNNVSMGGYALGCISVGSGNTAFGYLAGTGSNGNTSGCNNSFIGNSTYGPTATTCNTISLGNSSISCIRAQVSTITAFSDCRDKTNICSIPVGLEFVRALRPVKFEWNMRDNPDDGKKGKTESGFIAQELDQVVERFDAEWMQLVSKDNPDRWEATIGRLLPVLTRAVQELADEGDLLQAEIDLLQSQII
jgi:hypothetical protein